MKRFTTDAPKDNIETALNLFYIKDHETWVRGGGPAPDFKDVSLFDFTRSLIKAHIPTVEIPQNDNDFSSMMAEWLFDDADSAEGTIATLYTAAWAYAELRHRLMAYEDTGLEPEKIEQMKARLPLHNWAEETPDKLSIFGATVAHIQELLRAEREGLLVVLPCKVGDVVYGAEKAPVIPLHVIEPAVYLESAEGGDFETLDNFGTTVFLTREEAEAALEDEKI